MKYIFLILLTTCNTFHCVLQSTDEFNQVGRCKVSDTHYLLITLEEDMMIGDTLLIDKTNLRRLK